MTPNRIDLFLNYRLLGNKYLVLLVLTLKILLTPMFLFVKQTHSNRMRWISIH